MVETIETIIQEILLLEHLLYTPLEQLQEENKRFYNNININYFYTEKNNG